jgi:glycosyltransferase involved in cell wall biosynthesis
MTIVHLIDSEGMFGAEYVIYNLLPALQELGVNTVLGCLSPTNSTGSDIGRALEKRHIRVEYINEQKKISLKGLVSIYRILKRTHADILHVHGYKATILGGIIARLLKIPLFSTYHAEAGPRPELATYVKIETLFLRKASYIFTVSNIIRNELYLRGITKDKISVVYNGIEDPARENVKTKHVHSDNESINVLCIGRLIPIKRYDLVIDAIHSLHKEYPNISLSIAGSGVMEQSLKKKVEQYGLNDSIKILGYINDAMHLYQDADIFVLFSDTEGSPVVLIEAMAQSLPIISTSVGAIPEMVQNTKEALLVSPGDVSQLIDTLQMLIIHPELRKSLGKAARNRYEEMFTSKAMANSYIKQYEACLLGI